MRLAGRAAVISSSMRTSGSIASARARSTIRSVASGSAPGEARQVEPWQSQLGEPVPERLHRGVGQAQVGPDVEVGDDRRFLVDGHEAAAARLGRRVDGAVLAADRDPCRCRAGPRR